ncbi:hypothetical protein TCAL_00234 [Tigriopus californicus]|uniref:dCMP deaminase n=1 Tax=Tigriopus californicus TaxID=6832 RepID=A0A553P3H7_TIGCA|nr:hypothetical protein TCAL_00234 [Tigriopus californicus]|eukprot:TCALIF_00234-PA protein Name:"Similar to Dctd Deoxycytidylate deaminase (Rattus norvegicus)" AED:0.32 eAED:0.32 QI:0/0/0/1/1/1/2/0/116
MTKTKIAAKRSKDPATQVGAVIVNRKKRIVSIVYNGMPLGCHDDQMPWGYMFVCHAEMNAIVGISALELEGSTICLTLFRCDGCAKIIIQSGIRKVVYLSDEKRDRKETKASKKRS